MAILPRPEVDFTARDYDSLRLRLQGLARSVFPDWTDFNVAGFGSVILESFAYVGDVLAFYQDKQAGEAFLPTVKQRVSMIRLGRLINYSLRGARAATVDVRFTLPAAAARGLSIPAGTRVRTVDQAGPIRFRTTAKVRIEIGATQATAAAEQAVLVAGEAFTSTGAPNQEYVTVQSPFLEGSAVVAAADGAYKEIASFLDPDPVSGALIGASSKVFKVYIDQNDRARILFGTGLVGAIPQGVVTVDYKVGGGASGNVEAGKLVILEDPLLDDGAFAATPTVTNPLAAAGGVDRQTVAQARAAAPASLRVLTRTVAKEDFEVGALAIPGVARAVMVTSNEDAAIEENTGRLLVVAQGPRYASGRTPPATPSSATLADVRKRVTTIHPHTLTFVATVAAAPFRDINVSTRVFLDRGTTAATVRAAILAALQDFFAAQDELGLPNAQIDFGANIRAADGSVVSELAWSSVFNAVRDVAGVRKVDEGTSGLLLNGLRSSITLSPRDFPRLGTVTILDATTGIAL